MQKLVTFFENQREVVLLFFVFLTIGLVSLSSSIFFSPQVAKTPEETQVLGQEVQLDETQNNETQSPKEKVTITRVIDGDTVEIVGGQRVRYIGIDTPESKDPNKPVECFAREATRRNQELVEGKQVELEKDVNETDRYGRLLRYVYIDGDMVNHMLVEEGFAHASAYPPDVKYQDILSQAQQHAQEHTLGLWGSICQVSPTPSSSPTELEKIKKVPLLETNSPTFSCSCSKTCSQMSSCDEAYYQLERCGCSKRDGDNDGVPCETICSGG